MPDEHGRGCVRGTDEQIRRARQHRALWTAFKQCRKSMGPWLIPRLFWLGAPFLIIQGALVVISALDQPAVNLPSAWAGLGLLTLGPIALRIACELASTHFEIQSRLEELINRDD